MTGFLFLEMQYDHDAKVIRQLRLLYESLKYGNSRRVREEIAYLKRQLFL